MARQLVVQEAVLTDLIHSITVLSDILGTKQLTEEEIARVDYVLKMVQSAAQSPVTKIKE